MLQIKDLKASIGESEILRGLSLDVSAGEVHAIMGPNGSGKTTLLRCLLGQVPLPAGKVNVLGHEMTELSPARRDRLRADHLGVIFQIFNLVPYLSVIQNVVLPCRFSKQRLAKVREAGGPETEARRILTQLGLSDEGHHIMQEGTLLFHNAAHLFQVLVIHTGNHYGVDLHQDAPLGEHLESFLLLLDEDLGALAVDRGRDLDAGRLFQLVAEELDVVLEGVGLKAHMVTGSVGVGGRLQNPVDTDTYQMQKFAKHHGHFSGIDAERAENSAATTLRTLVIVAVHILDDIFGATANRKQALLSS